MKKRFNTILMILAALPTIIFAQTSGGPDQFGYTWVASDDTNGRPFQWVDISQTGTLITGMGDDNTAGPFPIGFSFRYYWLDYSTFYVGSNGYVYFGNQTGNISSTSSGFPTQPQPGGALNNYLGLLVSDLTFTDNSGNPVVGAEIRYQTIGDSCVISFINVPFWTDETPNGYRGSNTFQVILNRADSSITYNYLSSTGPVHSSYIGAGINFMTRGQENVTGSVGLSFPGNVYPSNSNIFVDYPETVTLSVKDAEASWVFNQQAGGIFAVVGNPLTVEAAVKNTGTDVIDSIIVYGSYLNSNFQVQMRDTFKILSPVAPGQTENFTFSKTVTPSTTGPFAYRIQIKPVVTGEYAANNTLITSVDVVDPYNAGSEFTLAYDDDNFDPNNGDGIITLDAGSYFEPPFYPAQVNAASFGLVPLQNATPQNQNGFVAKFYDKNLNLLETVTVQPSQTQIDFTNGMPVYNEARLTNPIMLNNPGDGVYVSFSLILVDSIRTPLLTDNSSHISRRTFETIGGIWSPYRSLSDEDFGIRLILANPYTSVSNAVNNGTFTLGQNYPNPANQSAVIPFTLKQTANATLTISDIMGRVVEVKDLGTLSAGEHKAELNTNNLPNGVYTYTLTAGSQKATLKMVVNH